MNMIIYFLFICFLEAFHCYVNLALNKPAFQQNPFYPNDNIGDAGNAVDGNKSDLSRNGGQCAISAGGVTATWWVNLTSIQSIQNITIYYMTDNKPWGATNPYAQSFFGFSVYVSNTTDKVNGSLCFKDENFTLETIPAVITAICPVYGQYVIYYNERLPGVTYPENNYYAENNVCEVEVYGCPPTGCYGSNNSFPCPDDNCHYCHKETGTCQVCKPGYKGQHCELECETGKYGINCSKSCGNCHNQSQCHNVHGFCSDGCSAGYNGSLCTEKCGFGKYGIKCSETCGNCRNQSHCQNVDGFCLWGCSAGYKGFFCTEPCDQTFHGITCSQKCSTNCSSQACHHVTGKCIDSSKTDEVLSNPVITGGISAGSALILVVIGIGVFYGIRKRKKEDESSVGSTCRSESTTTSSLSQKYDNIERGDHKSVSPKLLHTKGTKSETTIENGDGDTDTDDEIHMENPYGDHYVNNESIKEISISNLWNVMMEKSKSENDGFKKEYATLLYGERHPCEIGKHPENIPKNRFRTTFVYDHSRVILENQASDYINANFIDGLRQIHEYIATQGPKPITVDDFWMMIWQKNVVQIVMLTNLKEGARKKCAKYWPDKNAENDCHIFIIQTLEEKQYANYVTRKILMTNKKENEKRTITQYHYITWPDHGVPDPLCLLSFHNRVTRTKAFRHKGPTLVHCSAGIWKNRDLHSNRCIAQGSSAGKQNQHCRIRDENERKENEHGPNLRTI